MGEKKLQALLQESLATAVRTDALKPSDLSRVVVDTTVQPKNVMFPTDARLLQRAREILVRLTDDPAGLAFLETVLLPNARHRLLAPFGTYKFPEEMSFRICFSSDRSATSRFSRAFSFSKSFILRA